MIVLITGGCKNGKSNMAQDIAVRFSRDNNKHLYYVATMISTGPEDDIRIKKHVENRSGMGFETVEIKRQIVDLDKLICQNSGKVTLLLDSLTALLANEMFRTDDSGFFYTDMEATARICKELDNLIDNAVCQDADIIFVSDGIYSDAVIYDEFTNEYRRGLALIERKVAEMADRVIEMSAGADMNLQEADFSEYEEDMDECLMKSALIIGGAGQGKRAFARDKFGLAENEIYCFGNEDKEIPKGYRAYAHIERILRNWIETEAQTDSDIVMNRIFAEIDSSFESGAVLMIEDITCGIVPMNALDRKWREETGRLMQRLAKDRAVYRVFCGKGVRIK